MLKVVFRYDAAKVEAATVAEIAKALPGIIAGAFTLLGEKPALTAKDVAVRVVPIGPFDQNVSPVSIEIEAGRTPARQHSLNLGYLKIQLLNAIAAIPALQPFKGTRECFVSVVLADMAFGTI